MKIVGERLELDVPRPDELDWITQALQRPEVHLAFDCPRPPTVEEVRAGELHIAGHDDPEKVRFVIARHRGGAPVCFFLVFEWDGDSGTLELDSCIPDARERGMRNAAEAYILLSLFLYYNKWCRRFRVQQPMREGRNERPRWLEYWGGRYIGAIERVHPITGEKVRKHVHEHTMEGLKRAVDMVKRIMRTATLDNGELLSAHARWFADALATER